ncbi:MAG: Gfo/Idh/MocA family oxidoreductase [Agathobacter sp.]|nr:Gfo/Idh/MocA family oxidoreductase [Agathobacter sp.]
MTEVRIGIVGMGVQGSLYANILTGTSIPYMPPIRKPEGLVLTAVSSRSEQAKEFASHLEGVTYFCDWKEMIDSDLCDAIVITVPHYLHHEVAIYALNAGKHVLCEKPADVRASDVEKMISARDKANAAITESGKQKALALATLFNQRTNPLFRRIKELIASGELGELRRVNWICNNWWRPDSYYKSNNWRGTWTGEGGGITVNQIPHQLDLLNMLCGTPSRVYSVNRYGAHRDITVENDVTVSLEYPNGATGVFIACTHDPLGTDRLELDFDKGKIVVENSNQAIVYRFHQTEQEWNASLSMRDLMMMRQNPDNLYSTEEIKVNPTYGTEYVDIFENFANHILVGEPLFATIEDGLREVQLANSIQLSGWTGVPVENPSSMGAYDAWLETKIKEEKS